MPRTFRHLRFDGCLQIHALAQPSASISATAAKLQRPESAFCRELRRSVDPSGQHHQQAR